MFLARAALLLGMATSMARASPSSANPANQHAPDPALSPPRTVPDLAARAPAFSLTPRALPNITFNYTLTDMDTLLTYTPSSSGASDLTWENTFSDSPAPSREGRSIFGRGSSMHTTSMPGSTVSWNFYGDAVYVHGNASAGARIRLTTDGANADFVPAALNETDSIAWAEVGEGWHDVMLSVLDGEVSLARVTVRTGMRTQAPNFAAARTSEQLFLTGSDRNPFYKTSGRWDVATQVGGDDGTPSQPLAVLNGQPGATFTASVPDNSSYLLLNGTSQPRLAYYTVALSPPVAGSLPEATFNALQGYCNGVNFFMAPLDPEVQYTLTFSVSGNVLTGPVGVHSMKFWSALWTNGTDPNPSVSASSPGSSGTDPAPTDPPAGGGGGGGGGVSLAGAIAGGVVAGVVVFAVLAAVWFLYRRRQRKIHRKPEDNRFVVEELPDSEGPPYYRMGSVTSSRPSLVVDPYPYDPAHGSASDDADPSASSHTASQRHPLAMSTVPLSPGAPLSLTSAGGETRAGSTVAGRPVAGQPTERGTHGAHGSHGSYNRLSLATLSPEDEEILADPRPARPQPSQPSHPGPTTVAEKRALALQGRRHRARTSSRPRDQEVDAGRLPDTVPPSYDPSWAGDYESTMASRSRANSFTDTWAGDTEAHRVSRGSRGSMGSADLARIASLGNVAGMLERELERQQTGGGDGATGETSGAGEVGGASGGSGANGTGR